MDSATSPITLDQLHVLAAIADHGSFSAAARALRRAQSAVSYAIANLETQLGVVLFDRSTHRPKLTAAGEALLVDARVALRDVDRLRARARSMAEGVEPAVAIAVSVMFPMPELVAAVAEFRATYPQVTLGLHTEALGGVAQLVLDGACSVGVSEPIPRGASTLERSSLASIALVHVAAPSHPLAKRSGALPADRLEEHVQIVLADRTRLTEGVSFGVLGGPTWRVADLGAKLAFLRAGFGWGGMPVHLVADDLEAGRLVRITPDPAAGVSARVPLFAIHRAADPPGPAARWLLARLARSCGERAGDTAPERATRVRGRKRPKAPRR